MRTGRTTDSTQGWPRWCRGLMVSADVPSSQGRLAALQGVFMFCGTETAPWSPLPRQRFRADASLTSTAVRLSSALQPLEARGRGVSPLGDVKRQLHASAARLSSLAGRRVWRPTCGVLAAPAHGHNAGLFR